MAKNISFLGEQKRLIKTTLLILVSFSIYILILPRLISQNIICLNPLNNSAVELSDCNLLLASNKYLLFGIIGLVIFISIYIFLLKAKNKKAILILGLLLIAVFVSSYYLFLNSAGKQILKSEVFLDTLFNPQGEEVVNNVSLQNDFDGAKVKKSDLLQGCFGKDCIPSIDDPVFEDVQAANKWLKDSDRVFTLEYKGETRAYPQRIMNWHEIVNDEVAGDKLAITFCPLCGSALAFKREVNGVITQLGVSGKLHNNDLVMYDRYEGNLWQQITGKAIVGPAARRDEVLEKVSMFATTYGKWKREHPDTLVLSRDTGHSRNYNQYPYGTYEQDDELYFGISNLDKTLQIKTPVYGVELEGFSKAYPDSILKTGVKITDKIGNINLELEKHEDGDIIITRLDTNEIVIPIRLFWFAWAAFHPDTTIY